MGASPRTHAPPSVAVEVSALRFGTRADASFVEFALAVLEGMESPRLTRWSMAPLGRVATGARVARRPAARLAAVTAAVGGTTRSRRVASAGDVVHLASGPLRVEVAPPGVITIHHPLAVTETQAGSRDARKVRELLVRAAGAGVVVHAVTTEVAEQLVVDAGVPRESVAVAHPGIAGPLATTADGPAVLVAGGVSPSRDAAVLDALRASRVVSVGELTRGTAVSATCVVLVSAGGTGFPAVALEAMAAGCAVVAPRTPTNGALLGGAARLVDDPSPDELVEAALELVFDDAARSVAVTAGRTRAEDFSVRARATSLLALYARAMRGSGN